MRIVGIGCKNLITNQLKKYGKPDVIHRWTNLDVQDLGLRGCGQSRLQFGRIEKIKIAAFGFDSRARCAR